MAIIDVLEMDFSYEVHSHDCPKCKRRLHCELPMCHIAWQPTDPKDPKLGEDRLCNSCINQLEPGHEDRWNIKPYCQECGSILVTDDDTQAEYDLEQKRVPAPPHDDWCYAEMDIRLPSLEKVNPL